MLLLLMHGARARSTQLADDVLLRPGRERIENGKQTGRECTEWKRTSGGKSSVYNLHSVPDFGTANVSYGTIEATQILRVEKREQLLRFLANACDVGRARGGRRAIYTDCRLAHRRPSIPGDRGGRLDANKVESRWGVRLEESRKSRMQRCRI